MSGCNEQFEQFCKPQFEAMHVKLDKLDSLIHDAPLCYRLTNGDRPAELMEKLRVPSAANA